MKVKVSRIRHPLACFKGEINVEGERTAHAEEIKLAFDYFPIIDALEDESIQNVDASRISSNGDNESRNGSNGKASKDPTPERFVKYEPNS